MPWAKNARKRVNHAGIKHDWMPYWVYLSLKEFVLARVAHRFRMP